MLQKGLAHGRLMTVTVNGRSMMPLLQPDDQIVIAAVQLDQLAIGDIITILHQNSLLTHRFWGSSVGPDDLVYLHTRAERPFPQDPPTPIYNLVGRVVQRKRNMRVLNLQTGKGRWVNRHLILLLKVEDRLCSRQTIYAKIIHRLIKPWRYLIVAIL